MNYEIDIKIDETALDVEWLEQPALAIKYGVHWAECTRTLEQSIENIKLVRSELIKEVTSDPEKYLDEGVKPTGPIIEAYYRNHERHIEAKEEYIEAQYQLNIADIAKKEISTTRKAALQNLVELHGQHYFAGPSVPRELSNEVLRRNEQKSVDSGVALKMKRTKKK